MKSEKGKDLDGRPSSLFSAGDGKFTSPLENKLEINKELLASSELML